MPVPVFVPGSVIVVAIGAVVLLSVAAAVAVEPVMVLGAPAFDYKVDRPGIAVVQKKNFPDLPVADTHAEKAAVAVSPGVQQRVEQEPQLGTHQRESPGTRS